MKTRFAPSPTGPFHIGGLRTALLVQVLAQKNNGNAILRLEDTDTQRSSALYEQDISDSLTWVGMNFPTPYPKQSDRLARYASVIQKLLVTGDAYKCYMTVEELNDFRNQTRARNKADSTLKLPEKYDNRYRPENWLNGIPKEIKEKNLHPVIRLKMPTEGATQWNDLGKGGISVPNSQLDDLIIARSDGSPTYNFVVVVDDLDMDITHVIRGDDHISNTPKQIQISHMLRNLSDFAKKDKIEYFHIPLMFNPDGSKISKSALADPKNQAKVASGQIVPAALADYKKMGILPEALVNYLLLISSQKTADRIGSEMFSFNTYIKNINFDDLSKTAAQFDLAKLKEINFNYIQKLNYDSYKDKIHNFDSNLDIDAIDFSTIFTETQKRSKTLAQTVDIINQTINTKNKLTSIELTPLHKALLGAHDHDSFKAVITQEALDQGKKFGDIAKALRSELDINSGLPLYEVFESVKPKKALKLNM